MIIHHQISIPARRLIMHVGILCATLASLMPGVAEGASGCSVTANAGISFTYVPMTQTATTSSGTLQVSCTGLGSGVGVYTVALSAGRGTYAARKMTDGKGNSLTYNLYLNASDTLVWGDGSSSTLPFNGFYAPGNPTSTFTYYGLITPAAQDIPSGTYADSPTITVNF